MRKTDVIDKVSNITGIPKNDIVISVEAFLQEVKNTLKRGENVYVRGFGSFVIKKRAAKIGQDIRKGTSVAIPEHFIPAFKPAKSFSDAVKKGNAIKQ